MAVFAPMPKASDNAATAVNTGAFRNARKEKRESARGCA